MRKLQGKIAEKDQPLKEKEQSACPNSYTGHPEAHREREGRTQAQTETMQQEVQELRDQLQRVKDGKTKEQEDAQMELEELLEGQDPEKEQLRHKLEQAKKDEQTMQAQLQQIRCQRLNLTVTRRPISSCDDATQCNDTGTDCEE